MEFVVIDPRVGDTRPATSRRVQQLDEDAARRRIDSDEVTARIALMSQHVAAATQSLHSTAPRGASSGAAAASTADGGGRRPNQEWEQRTLDAFEVAESARVHAACKE